MTLNSKEPSHDCAWLAPENLRLNDEQKQHLRLLVGWLREQESRVKPLAQRLLGTNLCCETPSGLMGELVDRIREDFRSKPRDIILPLLGRIVHYHNRACPRSVLQLPEISIPLPRLTPPFIAERWTGLALYARCSKLVHNELKKFRSTQSGSQKAQIPPDELAIGRVLTSSVLWGGILCRQFLMDFYASLPHWRSTAEFIGGRAYITFVDTAGNCRRWLPDPITSLLLLGLPAMDDRKQHMSAKHLRSKCDRAILGYFGSLGLGRDVLESVPDLLDSALLHFELRLPRCLTEIAAGRHISYSPDPRTWARLTGMSKPHADSGPAAAVPDQEPGIELDPDISANVPRAKEVDRSQWLGELRELLGAHDATMTKADSKRAVSSALMTTDLDPTGRIFLQFAKHEISIHAGSTHRLRSIHDMVIAVARRLPALVNFEDPSSLSPDTLQGAYSMILDDSSSANQHRKVAAYLRAFHNFLVDEKLSEQINGHDIFFSCSEAALVDSNLITEDEYVLSRDTLIPPGQKPSSDQKDQTRHMAGLILILGYRCGLRRLEALKLRPCDLCEDDPAELLIRPWEQRRLKTPNATRKLPLFALLDPHELDLIKEWKREHPEHEGKDSLKSFLFSLRASPRAYISEQRVFGLIHQVLRDITGDDRVHYHVLRHSGCSTWLGFALLRNTSARLPGWLSRWPLQITKLTDDNVSSIRTNLYSNAFVTRRHLWAIAQTMGHASPVTSTYSYAHLNWELLGLWLDKDVPRLSVTALAKLAGISRQFASRKISGTTGMTAAWRIVEEAWKKAGLVEEFSGRLRQRAENVDTVLSSDEAQDEGISVLNGIWQVLHLHSRHKEISVADLAIRCGFSEDFITRLIANAEIAAALKVGEVGFVHRFQTDDRGARLCCPTPLGSQEQLESLRRLASNVFEALNLHQGGCLDIACHYLWQRRNDRNGLEFSWEQRRLAVMYAGFLVKIGLTSAELEIRCFSIGDCLEKWKKLFRRLPALGAFTEGRFAAARPPAPEKAGGNTIGIKVSLRSADNQSVGTPQASYGFRYLMLLASLNAVAKSCSVDRSGDLSPVDACVSAS